MAFHTYLDLLPLDIVCFVLENGNFVLENIISLAVGTIQMSYIQPALRLNKSNEIFKSHPVAAEPMSSIKFWMEQSVHMELMVFISKRLKIKWKTEALILTSINRIYCYLDWTLTLFYGQPNITMFSTAIWTTVSTRHQNNNILTDADS